MAGYDTPWMRMGTRYDGYPVLDPRSFRDVPKAVDTPPAFRQSWQEAQTQKLLEAERKLKEMQGAAVTEKEARKRTKIMNQLIEGRNQETGTLLNEDGTPLMLWDLLEKLEKEKEKSDD